MQEVSSSDAGRIIGKSGQTIRRYVDSGDLKARREGPRLTIWVEIDELRKFAQRFNYRFQEDVAGKILAK